MFRELKILKKLLSRVQKNPFGSQFSTAKSLRFLVENHGFPVNIPSLNRNNFCMKIRNPKISSHESSRIFTEKSLQSLPTTNHKPNPDVSTLTTVKPSESQSPTCGSINGLKVPKSVKITCPHDLQVRWKNTEIQADLFWCFGDAVTESSFWTIIFRFFPFFVRYFRNVSSLISINIYIIGCRSWLDYSYPVGCRISFHVLPSRIKHGWSAVPTLERLYGTPSTKPWLISNIKTDSKDLLTEWS